MGQLSTLSIFFKSVALTSRLKCFEHVQNPPEWDLQWVFVPILLYIIMCKLRVEHMSDTSFRRRGYLDLHIIIDLDIEIVENYVIICNLNDI